MSCHTCNYLCISAFLLQCCTAGCEIKHIIHSRQVASHMADCVQTPTESDCRQACEYPKHTLLTTDPRYKGDQQHSLVLQHMCSCVAYLRLCAAEADTSMPSYCTRPSGSSGSGCALSGGCSGWSDCDVLRASAPGPKDAKALLITSHMAPYPAETTLDG